jgi:hypothetical protein
MTYASPAWELARQAANNNSVALVHQRTIPTEQRLDSEVSDNLCG